MKHQQGLKRHNAQIVCSLWTLLHHTGPFSTEATETFMLPSLLSNSLHRDFTTLHSVICRLYYYITWEPSPLKCLLPSWHPACCLIPQTDVIFHTIFPGQHFSVVGRFIIATISAPWGLRTHNIYTVAYKLYRTRNWNSGYFNDAQLICPATFPY